MYLSSYIIYKNGKSQNSCYSWNVNPKIAEILEKAFYVSFNLYNS